MKFLVTKSFLAVTLTRACLADDEKRDYLVGAIKRNKEDRHDTEFVVVTAAAANEPIQDKPRNKKKKAAAAITRDKIHQRSFNQPSPDLDLGILLLLKEANIGQEQGRRRIRGYRKEQLDLFAPSSFQTPSQKPVMEPSSETSMRDEPSLSSSAFEESSFPSVVSGEDSSFPSIVSNNESSVPSIFESFVPSFPSSYESGESPTSTPTLGPSESIWPSSILPSLLPSSSILPSSLSGSVQEVECQIPRLQCQELFQSRYPGFFVRLSESCDVSQHMPSLLMYYDSEECITYRDMFCPTCDRICQEGYPISNIPIVACCAEACVESCGYNSCNLVDTTTDMRL